MTINTTCEPEDNSRTHEIVTLHSIFDELSTQAVETFLFPGILDSYQLQPRVSMYVPVTDDGGHYSQSSLYSMLLLNVASIL